jgi:enamine deaminase RidA (YjgF/YER057c/UK114 family)
MKRCAGSPFVALCVSRPPAATLAVISALASPDFLIEIEAIAAKA